MNQMRFKVFEDLGFEIIFSLLAVMALVNSGFSIAADTEQLKSVTNNKKKSISLQPPEAGTSVYWECKIINKKTGPNGKSVYGRDTLVFLDKDYLYYLKTIEGVEGEEYQRIPKNLWFSDVQESLSGKGQTRILTIDTQLEKDGNINEGLTYETKTQFLSKGSLKYKGYQLTLIDKDKMVKGPDGEEEPVWWFRLEDFEIELVRQKENNKEVEVEVAGSREVLNFYFDPKSRVRVSSSGFNPFDKAKKTCRLLKREVVDVKSAATKLKSHLGRPAYKKSIFINYGVKKTFFPK